MCVIKEILHFNSTTLDTDLLLLSEKKAILSQKLKSRGINFKWRSELKFVEIKLKLKNF